MFEPRPLIERICKEKEERFISVTEFFKLGFLRDFFGLELELYTKVNNRITSDGFYGEK